MRNLLITGLGLGNDFDNCYPCNYDHYWLVKFPSLLLWTNKFLIPKSIWNTITEEKYPDSLELAKSYKLVFEFLESKNLIEVIDSSEIFEKSVDEIIYTEIAKDIERIGQIFPGIVKYENDPDNSSTKMIMIDGRSYCPPILWSLYMSLSLSRALNAQCLFSSSALHYFRYKFGTTSIPQEMNVGYVESFRNIFNSFLPNETVFPEYSIENKERCNECTRLNYCSDSYLIDLEKNVAKYLEWRDYDEINQLKEMADNIIRENERVEGFINPEKVFNNYLEKENSIKKKVRLIFPQVKRWSNLATIASIPIAVFGIATQNPLLTIGSASLAGISKISSETISMLENKYRWINLIPSVISKSN